MFKIYKLTFPSKKSYIGITKQTFEERMSNHKYVAFHKKNRNYNLLLYKAIRKYGWDNFTKEVILDKVAENKIDELERQYIKNLNTLAPNGYNLESGGIRNKNHSEKSKKKISKSLKGKYISEKHKQSKKILQYDLDMNFIKEWFCGMDIERELKIGHSFVSRVCRGTKMKDRKGKLYIPRTAGGFIWRYSE